MLSAPGGSDWVVQVATLPFSPCITGTGLHLGIGLPLLVKVTFPVGSSPTAVTVAVKVTDWFTSDGLREEASCVVVAIGTLLVNSIHRTPVCPPEASTSKFTYQCCLGAEPLPPRPKLQPENFAEAIWVLQ